MPSIKLTLPESQSSPATLLKLARNEFIARYIVIEFAQPKFDSALWGVRKFAARMSMPKAAVHEQSCALSRKNKIWFAKYTRVSSPARNAVVLE